MRRAHARTRAPGAESGGGSSDYSHDSQAVWVDDLARRGELEPKLHAVDRHSDGVVGQPFALPPHRHAAECRLGQPVPFSTPVPCPEPYGPRRSALAWALSCAGIPQRASAMALHGPTRFGHAPGLHAATVRLPRSPSPIIRHGCAYGSRLPWPNSATSIGPRPRSCGTVGGDSATRRPSWLQTRSAAGNSTGLAIEGDEAELDQAADRIARGGLETNIAVIK